MKSGGTAGATLNGNAADERAAYEVAVDEKIAEGQAADERIAEATVEAAGGASAAAEVVAAAAEAAGAAEVSGAAEAAIGAVSPQLGLGQPAADQRAVEQPAVEHPAVEQPAAGLVAEAISREQRAAQRVHSEEATEAHRQALVLDFFAQPVHDYVYQSLGRPVTLLRAGCVTPLAELGLDKLRHDGFDLNVVTVDVGHSRRGRTEQEDRWARTEPESHRVRTEPETGGEVTVGDLRAIPLPPRSFDVVYCSLLLDRISHVQLVLDRFAAALRPGGLLLLRIRDRDSAASFLDRRLPGWARRALWTRLYPGEPGPFPAVYEPTASGRGIAAYMLMRGLVITQRRTARTLPSQPERLARFLSVTYGLVAWLSRGRLTDAHDEMLFVIRKPEDRFARVVLTPRRPGRRTCP